VAEYAVALCDATRHPASYQLGDLQAYVAYGASPRGSINLVAAARALAVLRGRGYALPQDVQELARDVLRHRLVLTYQALAEQVSADAVLTAVLEAIPAPRIDLAREQPA
jgi:MoxR-like ATPase